MKNENWNEMDGGGDRVGGREREGCRGTGSTVCRAFVGLSPPLFLAFSLNRPLRNMATRTPDPWTDNQR